MNKILMWIGAIVAVWSLTNAGAKSAYFVLSVLSYVAIVCWLTFRSAKRVDLDADLSA